jgi:hypothetical protein
VRETNFESSATFGGLAEALAKAQGEIQAAKRDQENPFFHSRYADLAAVWEACRQPLAKNGLAIVQLPGKRDGHLFIDTILMHSSGQWISSRLFMTPVKDDPQGVGSAITYARRYGLQAMVGIAPDDDDGNAASGRDHRQEQRDESARRVGREEPVASDPSKFAGDWREVVMHWETPKFKVKGKKLGELDPRQLKFLQDKWNPKPSPRGGFIAKEDRILRAALDKSMEPEKTTVPPPVEPDSDELPMFNGPNHQSLYERLQAEWFNPQRFTETMAANGALPDGVTFGNVTDEQAKGFLVDWENVEAAMKAAAK